MSETATTTAPTATHTTVCDAVVAATAELTDTDACSLDPLYHTVDPEALEALFAAGPGRPSPRRVRFTYCDCAVVVAADGVVTVSAGDEERSKRWTRVDR